MWEIGLFPFVTRHLKVDLDIKTELNDNKLVDTEVPSAGERIKRAGLRKFPKSWLVTLHNLQITSEKTRIISLRVPTLVSLSI